MNLLISQLRMGLACKYVMTSKEQHGRRSNLKKNSQMMLDSNLNQEKTFLDSMLMSLLNKLLRHNHKISKTHREHIIEEHTDDLGIPIDKKVAEANFHANSTKGAYVNV